MAAYTLFSQTDHVFRQDKQDFLFPVQVLYLPIA